MLHVLQAEVEPMEAVPQERRLLPRVAQQAMVQSKVA